MRGRAVLETSRVELLLQVRDPLTLIFALGLPVMFTAVLSGVFGDTPDPTGEVFRGVGGSTYYAPAYVALVAGSVGLIALPTQLASYRELGVLRRFRATGLPVQAVLGAQLVVGILISLVGAALVLALSFSAYSPEPPTDPAGVAVAFVVGTLALLLLGLAIGALLPSVRTAQGLGVLIWFVSMLVGGAGPPPEVLPTAMNTLGSWTPLHPMIVAVQDPWFGEGTNRAMLAVLAGIGAVSATLAALRLARD